MQRLEGMDASFVYLETPAAPMQVAMTCVFDPSTAPDGYSFAKVRELVENRLHLVPPFRRRLVGMPGLLHRPGWIEDPDCNLDLHLRRVGLRRRAGSASECYSVCSFRVARQREREPQGGTRGLVNGLS